MPIKEPDGKPGELFVIRNAPGRQTLALSCDTKANGQMTRHR